MSEKEEILSEEIKQEEEIKKDPKPEEENYQDKYLRALAEMENMRKRMQKEKQEMMRFAEQNVIADFLKPLDNFENALGFSSYMSDETKNWAKGFEMILMQFKEILSIHGIEPFDAEGKCFDPHLHEAVEMQETEEAKEGTILKQFTRGYKSGDQVLRAARVIVAKPPAPKINPINDEEKTHD